MPPTHIRRLRTGLLLPQDRQNLLLAELDRFIVRFLSMAGL
jgi:hypothetical protein